MSDIERSENREAMLKMFRSCHSFRDIADAYEFGQDHLGFSVQGLSGHIAGNGLSVVLISTRDPEQYVRRAELLKEYAESCAPVFHSPIVTEDGYVVLLFGWRGGADESDLAPYDPKTATPEQKLQFYYEVSRIADAGLEHPYITYGFAHWKINPRTASIVLTNWEDADFMAPGTRKGYLRKIMRMLA